MTDTAPPAALPAFRGPVTCLRSRSALTLAGAAADSADEILLLTFVASAVPDVPAQLDAASVDAVDEHRYRIVSGSQDWIVRATAVHVHRDIGGEFYRAIPPRSAPLRKRLFWLIVLALAGTRAGKRLLLSVRGRT